MFGLLSETGILIDTLFILLGAYVYEVIKNKN